MTDVWTRARRGVPPERRAPRGPRPRPARRVGGRARRTALDVATGGGHVARRLREAGLEVVTRDPVAGDAAGRRLPRRGPAVRRRAASTSSPAASRAHHFDDVRSRGRPRWRASAAGSVADRGQRSTCGETLEEAEQLRDPSHVRNYTEDGVARPARGRRPRGRGRSSPFREADRARAVARAVGLRRRGGRAGARAARRPGRRRTAGPRSTRLALEGGEAPDGDHRRQRHAARRPGPDRLARGASTACATAPTARNVVAGVTPGQGRPGRRGHPGLRHRRRGGRRDAAPTRRWSSCPARFAADAIYEAVDAGIGTVICITEGAPGARDAAGLQLHPAAAA